MLRKYKESSKGTKRGCKLKAEHWQQLPHSMRRLQTELKTAAWWDSQVFSFFPSPKCPRRFGFVCKVLWSREVWVWWEQRVTSWLLPRDSTNLLPSQLISFLYYRLFSQTHYTRFSTWTSDMQCLSDLLNRWWRLGSVSWRAFKSWTNCSSPPVLNENPMTTSLHQTKLLSNPLWNQSRS